MDASPVSEREPLTPITTTTKNVKSNSTIQTKKRKRDGTASAEPRWITFRALVLSTNQPDTNVNFQPIATVNRENIPLTWLDTSVKAANLQPGSVFRAHIPDIDLDRKQVLIARLSQTDHLYAVERVDHEHYIACGLQGWVSEAQCQEAATGIVPATSLTILLGGRRASTSTHSRQASASSASSFQTAKPPSPRIPKNRRGVLARMSIMTSKAPADAATDASICLAEIPDQKQLPTPVLSAVCMNPVTPAAGIIQLDPFDQTPIFTTSTHLVVPTTAILESASGLTSISSPNQNEPLPARIRRQYFETLYLSKTALAFYAKGPLSRMRSQAQDAAGSHEAKTIVSLYRELLLPSKKADTKYKTSLSETVRGLPKAGEADANVSTTKPRRKATEKKLKLSKDGLWTGEKEHIEKWWHDRELDQSPIRTSEEMERELQHAIKDLRMRETLMQLQVMLEILILEKIAKKLDMTITADIPTKQEVGEKDVSTISAKVLAETIKKPQDVTTDIEAILDKLCIWQSVELDFSSSLTDVESITPTTKSRDQLRDFCADVIIPFYATKLPEQCKSICRKLGGPEISPKRPPSKTKTKSGHQPAATVKQRPKPLLKKTLERMLSEEKNSQRAFTPSLVRSATAPSVPNLKREPSEALYNRPISRGGGLQKSASFSNREIDLVADARAVEAKRRKLNKLADQKKELDAAINALKKPNRGIAAKEFMDDVEKRRSDSTLNREDQQVQITATPRRNKSNTQPQDKVEPHIPMSRPYQNSIPNNEKPLIPASSTKPVSVASSQTLSHHIDILTCSKQKRAVLAAIHDTPSRDHTSKLLFPSRLDPNLIETPIKPRSQSQIGDSIHSELPAHQNLFGHSPLAQPRFDLKIPERAGRAMDRVMGHPDRSLPDMFGVDGIDENDPFRSKSFTKRKQLADVNDIPNSKELKSDQTSDPRNHNSRSNINNAAVMDCENADERKDPGDIYDTLGWNDDVDDI